MALSYQIGGHFWPPARGAGLEDQIASYVADVFRRAQLPSAYSHDQLTSHFCSTTEAFRWGSSPIRNIPANLRCAQTLLELIPEGALQEEQMARLTGQHYTPLLPWVVGGIISSALLLLVAAIQKRSGWRLAAWAGTLAPFYLPFLAIPQEASLRRIGPAILFLPVVLAVVHGGLLASLPRLLQHNPGLPLRALGWLLPPLGLLLMVLGVLKSPLAPNREMQNGYMESGWEDIQKGFQRPLTFGTGQQCGVGRLRDMAAGQPEESRFFPWYPLIPMGR